MMERDDLPPWPHFIPDPDPPTPEAITAKLRDRLPGVYGFLAQLIEKHPIVVRCRWFHRLVLRPFETIADGLPFDLAVTLVPVAKDEMDFSAVPRALRLLNRANRLKLKGNRRSFPWPQQDVYEANAGLRKALRNTGFLRLIREAARVIYRLFLHVAIALERLYERKFVGLHHLPQRRVA